MSSPKAPAEVPEQIPKITFFNGGINADIFDFDNFVAECRSLT